jgi:PTS system nitrogen regulatory IIA component
MKDVKIATYLTPDLIFFLKETEKEEILRTLVTRTMQVLHFPEGEKFYQAIIERERIVSTGIGMGVAIPHAKLPTYQKFFITIGILQKGAEWQALDKAPVRLVCMIGGPENKQTEYLKILSALTASLRDESLRKKIILAESPQEVLQLFETF